MSGGVLIDYQIKGWAKKNEQKIKNNYSEIRYVGEPPNPGAGSSDSILASFCVNNDYDMLTSDKKAYATWLEGPGPSEVCISVFDNEQNVYRIRMT